MKNVDLQVLGLTLYNHFHGNPSLRLLVKRRLIRFERDYVKMMSFVMLCAYLAIQLSLVEAT